MSFSFGGSSGGGGGGNSSGGTRIVQNQDPQVLAMQAAAARRNQQAEDDQRQQVQDGKDRANRIQNDAIDLQNYSKKSDYDLDNQKKAWESANQFRMKEADQSNVAQKDRLEAQLGNQRTMQTATIDQANRLRRDDNQRAIDGFKGNF